MKEQKKRAVERLFVYRRWMVVTLLWLFLTGCVQVNNVPVIIEEEKEERNWEEEGYDVQVHFLALKNGESTLIQTQEANALIDTGRRTTAQTLFHYLEQMEVKQLDWLFLTNASPEHMGALEALVEHVPVKTIVVPELIADTIIQKPVPDNIQVRKEKAGDTISLQPSVTVKVLHPTEPLFLSPQDNSMVLQLTHERLKFLFTSDINSRSEKRLVSNYALKSHILKVSDFGSNQGSTQPFLEEVDAQVALIFTNEEQATGKEEVKERLSESWIDTYEMKQHGTVTIHSNGNDYEIEKEK